MGVDFLYAYEECMLELIIGRKNLQSLLFFFSPIFQIYKLIE